MSERSSRRPSVLWVRRDLRLGDHPALAVAATTGPVLPLFVADPALLRRAGAPRLAALRGALEALDRALDGRLCVVSGTPTTVVPAVARAVDADTVHVSEDFAPYGAARDRRVERALAQDGRALVRTGSPYAVSPGRVRTRLGEPYKVFTPFRRAWYEHGWPAPAHVDAGVVGWCPAPSERNATPVPVAEAIPVEDPHAHLREGDLGPFGEDAALDRWVSFRAERLAGYAADRDRPDLDTTSRLGVDLKFGTIHPRTLLADLASLGATDSLPEDLASGRDAFASELAWREFYADVLHHRPRSAREEVDLRFAGVAWATGAEAEADFEAWKAGRTGYPIVDAGMRQLLAEGWMHNRLRMITASFLAKDLHVDWRRGAAHFLDHLVDGDLASNQHGWQWTAGTGTDAAPYFRVFNPVAQGRRFDPEGDYVRRWVPELRGVAGPEVHEPRTDGEGGYPAPIVDHAQERRVAIARYEAARDAAT